MRRSNYAAHSIFSGVLAGPGTNPPARIQSSSSSGHAPPNRALSLAPPSHKSTVGAKGDPRGPAAGPSARAPTSPDGGFAPGFTMNYVGTGLLKGLRRVLEQQRISVDLCRKSRAWSSTVCFSDLDEKGGMGDDDDYTDSRRELEPQSVDPKKGWGFRGVHRAIICGKVGQVPVQKILRNGRTVTVFTVGTGGMFDQRVVGAEDLPKPAQWHRIAVHNEQLGAYAVQKLAKNSAVYVEGDIETRVYNDSINDQVRNIPEICVRRDGKIRLVKSGESAASISLDELREGFF